MIRCPNLRDEKTRGEFNRVLERLGGLPMTADDITPRQPYIARLNEAQERAYFQSYFLWNAHRTPAEIGKFLDALDGVRDALAAEAPAKTPAPSKKAENESGRTPSVPPGEQKNAPTGNKLPAPAGKPFAGMIENQEAYRAAAKERRERRGGTQRVYPSTADRLRAQGSSVEEDNAERARQIDAQRPAFDAALMRAEIRPQDVSADLREAALARMLDRGEDAWTALDNVIAEAEHEAGWLHEQAAIDEVEKNRTADERLNALFQEVSPQAGAAPAENRGQAAEGAAAAGTEAGPNQPRPSEGAGEPAAEAKPAVTERTAAG